MRRARVRSEMPRVALVGYTNAGKSTLFNALTGADAYAADQLFATLDPTVRRIDAARRQRRARRHGRLRPRPAARTGRRVPLDPVRSARGRPAAARHRRRRSAARRTHRPGRRGAAGDRRRRHPAGAGLQQDRPDRGSPKPRRRPERPAMAATRSAGCPRATACARPATWRRQRRRVHWISARTALVSTAATAIAARSACAHRRRTALPPRPAACARACTLGAVAAKPTTNTAGDLHDATCRAGRRPVASPRQADGAPLRGAACRTEAPYATNGSARHAARSLAAMHRGFAVRSYNPRPLHPTDACFRADPTRSSRICPAACPSRPALHPSIGAGMAWNIPGKNDDSGSGKDKRNPWKPAARLRRRPGRRCSTTSAACSTVAAAVPLRWIGLALVLWLVFNCFVLVAEQRARRGAALRPVRPRHAARPSTSSGRGRSSA